MFSKRISRTKKAHGLDKIKIKRYSLNRKKYKS